MLVRAWHWSCPDHKHYNPVKRQIRNDVSPVLWSIQLAKDPASVWSDPLEGKDSIKTVTSYFQFLFWFLLFSKQKMPVLPKAASASDRLCFQVAFSPFVPCFSFLPVRTKPRVLGLFASLGDLDALQGEAGPHFKRRLQPTAVPRGWLMQLFPCRAAFFKVLILIKKKERIWSSYFDLVPRIIWKFFFLERDFLFQISPWWGERVSWAELG